MDEFCQKTRLAEFVTMIRISVDVFVDIGLRYKFKKKKFVFSNDKLFQTVFSHPILRNISFKTFLDCDTNGYPDLELRKPWICYNSIEYRIDTRNEDAFNIGFDRDKLLKDLHLTKDSIMNLYPPFSPWKKRIHEFNVDPGENQVREIATLTKQKIRRKYTLTEEQRSSIVNISESRKKAQLKRVKFKETRESDEEAAES